LEKSKFDQTYFLLVSERAEPNSIFEGKIAFVKRNGGFGIILAQLARFEHKKKGPLEVKGALKMLLTSKNDRWR
jgi:hypothetical protein